MSQYRDEQGLSWLSLSGGFEFPSSTFSWISSTFCWVSSSLMFTTLRLFVFFWKRFLTLFFSAEIFFAFLLRLSSSFLASSALFHLCPDFSLCLRNWWYFGNDKPNSFSLIFCLHIKRLGTSLPGLTFNSFCSCTFGCSNLLCLWISVVEVKCQFLQI